MIATETVVPAFQCPPFLHTLRGRRDSASKKRHFLVPIAEYDARSRYGFVVDPVRHKEIAAA